VRGLDIGTGASAIYPLLGARVYGWSFLGTDIDEYVLWRMHAGRHAGMRVHRSIFPHPHSQLIPSPRPG